MTIDEQISCLSKGMAALIREEDLRQRLNAETYKTQVFKILEYFYSAAEAEGAAEVLNSVVRRKEVPADMPVVPLPEGITRDSAIRVDKLLARAGRAESVSDGARKIKPGAVEINGERIEDVTIGNSSSELVTQVGKKWCRVLTGRP